MLYVDGYLLVVSASDYARRLPLPSLHRPVKEGSLPCVHEHSQHKYSEPISAHTYIHEI